jgi:hypothetical protein
MSQKPKRRKALALLLPAALLIALFSINIGSAQAYVPNPYCGVLLPPEGLCSGGAHTNLQGNVAQYPGAPATHLWVCQRVYDNTLGKYVSASCAKDTTGTADNVIGYLGHSLTPYVQNGSNVNSHTVQGYWYSP